MRAWILTALGLALLAVLPLAAETVPPKEYTVENPRRTRVRDVGGKTFITVAFTLKTGPNTVPTERDMVVIREDGQVVAKKKFVDVKESPLTAALALDVSGSMANNNKLDA